ncbi:MAG: tetratricopeptide repeat protein [Kangiellaceae bacterium]|nr:tetratricopeptide repeat protein [Kangiellaceae bacterium]
MAQYETEEQQVEAIKQFWKENGTAIILGAVIGFGGLFGWNYYKDYKQQQAEKASQNYAAALQSIQAGQTENPEFVKQAEAIKADFSDTSYAALSALKLAQQYVEQNKLTEAAEQLAWVVDQSNDTFESVATLRLARVQLQQAEYDKAISTAASISEDAYKSSALLVKGEALLAQEKIEDAKNAFIEARDAAENVSNPLLAMRLAEFGINEKQVK